MMRRWCSGNYVTPLDERMAGSPGGGAILIPEGAEVSRG